MAMERAHSRAVAKPWGRRDLRPWSNEDHGDTAIGEIWFSRDRSEANDARLLVKLLFTTEPLSVQVHPNDVQANAIGEPNGKTEAWYVLEADPAAAVALGPKRSLTDRELRNSVEDDSTVDLMRWLPAVAGDLFVVPAGTIHAIGAGLVIVEIQQRSDTTYRLFDFGRSRSLQVEQAIGVSCRDPAEPPAPAMPMGDGRTAIAVTPFFVLERVDLAARSLWIIETRWETWAMAISGDVDIGKTAATVGDAIFLQAHRALLVAGDMGATLLVAYAHHRPDPGMLRPAPRYAATTRVAPMETGAAQSRREDAAFPETSTGTPS